MSDRYAPLLSTLKTILASSGCSPDEIDSIAKEAADVATGIFRSPLELLAEGRGEQLGDLTDVILIGVIVTRYGMVMGNPFTGKE
jgi:hypothetical protein